MEKCQRRIKRVENKWEADLSPGRLGRLQGTGGKNVQVE